MMTPKAWKIARTALIVVVLLGLSFGIWAYLTTQALKREAAILEAKELEEWNKRYPVKGRRTDLGDGPSLQETGAAPLDSTKMPGMEGERPRMRISRGEDP